MYINTRTIAAIAEKECADHIRSPVFLMIAATFTLVVLAWTYVKGMEVGYTVNVLGMPDIMRGFKGMAEVLGRFAPVLGIILGFGTINKEIRSGSMNVLLTHPAFRDNIILGKILGSSIVIFLTLFIAVNAAAGVLLAVSGMTFTFQYIVRLELFVILTFFYVLFYLAAAVLVSVFTRKQNIALVTCIIFWMVTTILLSGLVYRLLIAATDDYQFAQHWTVFFLPVLPGHHYAMLSVGLQNVMGNFPPEPLIRGIFDTAYTLSDWFIAFLPNLIVLLGAPVILISIAVSLFLRRDVTL